MYEVYIKMAQGGVALNDYTPQPGVTDDTMNFKEVIQDVNYNGALIMKSY